MPDAYRAVNMQLKSRYRKLKMGYTWGVAVHLA